MDSPYEELERRIQDPDVAPRFLPFGFLKAITRDFSSDLVLGEGGFGVVYNGVLRCGKFIAVKKLFEIRLREEAFQNEVIYLMRVEHKNVVRFVGYCAESRWEVMEQPCDNARRIWAEIPKRLLCFEYVPNQSLDTHISEASSGLDWNTRYMIINGICSGVHFLHDNCHLVHLDLKPQNILMDSTMTPKIADFGLSRLFGEDHSRVITGNCLGTRGYTAPEYINQGVVSKKADIFSLGVILIQIITGRRNYPYFQQDHHHSTTTSLLQFTEEVLGSWTEIFVSTPMYSPVEIYMNQVRQCITIALKCVHPDKERRPTANDIIQMLNALDQVNSEVISGLMEIFIKDLTGKIYTIQAKSSDTVRSVIVRLEQQEGHRMRDARLIFAGKSLEHGSTLAHYNITEHSTLHVVIRLGNGPYNPKRFPY